MFWPHMKRWSVPLLSKAVTHDTVGVPFVSEATPTGLAPIDTSWYPALAYDDLDSRYSLPPILDSTAKWASTICILPKWKSYEWTYEHMTRMALAGDRTMAKYLTWLKSTYSKVYLEKGAKSPGIVRVSLEGSSLMQVMHLSLWRDLPERWLSEQKI